MKTKKVVKIAVDAAMLVLLLLQMALPVTGGELHEWLGIALFALFIVHHILNFSFYKTLFKGKYNAARIIITVLNIVLLEDFVLLAISGVIISSYVFEFLDITEGLMTARQTHLCASYWGLVIMSAHLGINWGAVFPVHKIKKGALKWVLRGTVIAVSGFGIYAFIEQKLMQYLFLQTHFVFFDYEANKILFFAEYIAMITLFAAAFYYISKLLKRTRKGKNNENN